MDAAIDELGEEGYQLGVHATLALCERSYACEHGRAYKEIIQRFAHSGRVGADDVILQVAQMTVFHAPLSHRAETGVDAVDHLIA